MPTGISGLYKNTKGAKIARGEKIKHTNFERIKAMSVEEMARENIYFIPDCRFAHYTGLSGKYRKTSAEVIQDNIKYLESEVSE